MDTGNSLCIEDIMQQIREEIKEKNLTSDMLSFEDVPFRKAVDMNSDDSSEVNAASSYINNHYYIQPYKELDGNPVKVFIKKVIRKLTKFYVEPITFEQNEFNINAVKVINHLKNSSSNENTQKKTIDELINRIEVLELQQKNLLGEIDKLRSENSGKQEIK